MFPDSRFAKVRLPLQNFAALIVTLLVSALFLPRVSAQDQTQPPADQSQNQTNGKQKQDVPDEAGGPTGDIGRYAIPRKNAEAPPPAPPPPVTPKKVEGMPDYSIKVNVPAGECGCHGHHQKWAVRPRP